jgi:hypothetical protein
MNTELAAMIEAGRKLIETQSTAEQLKAAEAETEALRLKSTHLAKLPPWMHEWVTVTHWDHSVRIYLDLPGCAPMYVDSCSWEKGFARIGVSDPLSILFDDDEGWYASCTSRTCEEIEVAVAIAAEHGESYWAMRAEADRRNAEGLRPEPTPEPELVPAPLPPTPAERIAAALERIAAVLEGFSDNSEANDALRVNVLR